MNFRDVTALNILEAESTASQLEAVEARHGRVNVFQRLLHKAKGKDTRHALVALIDPVTSGVKLAEAIKKAGYKLLYIFTKEDSEILSLDHASKRVHQIKVMYYDTTVPSERATRLLMREINDFCEEKHKELKAVLPAAETGVELADRLSEKLGLQTNGARLSEARRNKSMMQDKIASAGLRSIKHKLVYTEEEVTDFYATLGARAKCIVKPNKSSGSDGVSLCTDLNETKEAFNKLREKPNAFGSTNHGVLLEEFLEGTEYVVDGVSLDGEYKVTAIWRYDKKSANGAPFVYFGMTLVDAGSDSAKALVDYAEKVLECLEVKHGPSHMELMLQDNDNPCLIEVGSRCHGGGGSWIPVVEKCIGYSQIEMTVMCYLDQDRFAAAPKRPSLKKSGAEIHLVSFQEGKLKKIPGKHIVRKLKSFESMSLHKKSGQLLERTVDAFTRPGSIQLVAESPEQLSQDYAAIRELEEEGLFFTVH